MVEEKLYFDRKLILAIEMDERAFLSTVKNQDVQEIRPRPGYKVIYPDGTISWSPKKTLEMVFRELTASEKELYLNSITIWREYS